VKIRIKKTPAERDIDGVSLKGMTPGTVRDVSAVLGSWLITEGYADSEMRQARSTDELDGCFSFERHPSMPRERRGQKR
jgi:hypothetical protein